MIKRSLTLAGHRTSIALEPEFWSAAEDISAEKGITLSQFIAGIDEARTEANLSSAVRTAILAHYRGISERS